MAPNGGDPEFVSGGRKSVISFTDIYVCKIYIYVQNMFYRLGNLIKGFLYLERDNWLLSYMNSIFLSNTDLSLYVYMELDS